MSHSILSRLRTLIYISCTHIFQTERTFCFAHNLIRMKFSSALVLLLPLLVEQAQARFGGLRRQLKSAKTSKDCKAPKSSKSSRSFKSSKSSKGMNFNRIATFAVCSQIDGSCNDDTETSAEIVTASEDGMTLIYSDSPYGVIGFIDISDPTNPLPAGVLDVGGEPTSVAVWGDYAVAAVNTSEDFVNTSGSLVAIDIATKQIVKTWALGGQPDAVAVSPDGKYVVVAVENERDEDLGEGIPPQVSFSGGLTCSFEKGSREPNLCHHNYFSF